MKNRHLPSINRAFVAIYSIAIASAAHAHEGHGQSGPHWHATDVWGLMALGVAIAVAIYLSRGKK